MDTPCRWWQTEFMKALSLAAVVFALTLLGLACVGFVLNKEALPVDKLQQFLVEDVQKLEQAHALPAGVHSLSQLELHGGTERAREWLKSLKFPFPVKKDGTHTLEILLVDWNEGTKDGVMVQYNLVDNKSGNMIWELGRTFILKDSASPYYHWRSQLMNWLRH
jgi:hypothetical protein